MKARQKGRKPPSYRHHKPTGQAFVELSGKRHYLGRRGTPESRRRYKQLIAEWQAAGGRAPVDPGEITIVELLAQFIQHAEAYYTVGHELATFKTAIKPLQELYETLPAAEFTPRYLKTVRGKMIAMGWCRNVVNRQTSRIRHIFKWATAEALIPPTVYPALGTLAGVRRGRSEARESEPVRPVDVEHVAAIKPHVSAQVWAMVRLQELTGMRPAEVVAMRPCDLDLTASPWEYTPQHHKLAHHGISGVVYLGPKAQAEVNPFLAGRRTDACLFSPAEADQERRAKLAAERVTPMSCGNVPGSNRKRRPEVKPGECYTVDSYRRAIERGCDLAFTAPDGLSDEAQLEWRKSHRWSPNRLRHSFATQIRRTHGIDAAQALLGHQLASRITEVYAEVNSEKARKIALRVG